MYGKRARLGVIVPSTNTTVEPELRAVLPHGVELYATRILVEEVATEKDKASSLLAMHKATERATAELASLGPSAIAYACTSGSFLNGRDADEAMCEQLSATYAIPVVTTSSCMVAALSTLRAQRIALATPYVASVADRAAGYLDEAGFAVVSRHDLHILSNLAKGQLEPAAAAAAALKLDVVNADAVMISCTNWRTIDVLPAVEQQLGIAAVSSNLVTLWGLLRLAGINDRFPPVQLMSHDLLANVRRAWETAAKLERTHA